MMTLTRLSHLVLAVMVAISCAACASVGRDFNYTNVPSLEIGSLKSEDYHDIFGKPRNVQMTVNSDGKFEDVRFIYAHANIASASSRVLDLEFRNGKLNAWLYISGFDEDRTAVDLAGTDKIKKNVSTKSDVQALLGKPHGKAHCPSLLFDYKDRCHAADIWAWGAVNKLVTLGRNPTETSTIYILFDDNSIVTEIETVQTTRERRNH